MNDEANTVNPPYSERELSLLGDEKHPREIKAETPRTDALPKCGAFHTWRLEDVFELARTLERELATERQARERAEDRYNELREFVRIITLQLQRHRSLGEGAKDELFQYAYRMYVKHDVENCHPECSICRRRHGKEIQHPCE